MAYNMKGSPMLRNFGIGTSPVKQTKEEKEKERPASVAPPGMTPRPSELDTSTTPGTRVYPYPSELINTPKGADGPKLPRE